MTRDKRSLRKELTEIAVTEKLHPFTFPLRYETFIPLRFDLELIHSTLLKTCFIKFPSGALRPLCRCRTKQEAIEVALLLIMGEYKDGPFESQSELDIYIARSPKNNLTGLPL